MKWTNCAQGLEGHIREKQEDAGDILYFPRKEDKMGRKWHCLSRRTGTRAPASLQFCLRNSQDKVLCLCLKWVIRWSTIYMNQFFYNINEKGNFLIFTINTDFKKKQASCQSYIQNSNNVTAFKRSPGCNSPCCSFKLRQVSSTVQGFPYSPALSSLSLSLCHH